MKYTILCLLTVFYLSSPALAKAPNSPLQPSIANSGIIPYKISIPTEEDQIITFLAKCESGNNEKAINPKDVDGTASLGKFQFKKSTLYYFGTKYGILHVEPGEIMNVIFDGDLQEKVVREMWRHKVDFSTQFPSCFRQYNQLK